MKKLSDAALSILEVREDFELYAPMCMRILTKAGQLVPLELNSAQLIIHAAIEKQLRETGRVRAMILKGRQQGACLSPDARVLTASLEWKRIDDLVIGEEIIATDENTQITQSGAYAKGRKMRTATVDAVVRTRLPAYKITLDDGRTLICSGNHKWLVRGSQTQWSWRSIEGPRAIRVGWKLRSVTETWDDPSFDDGWFGGMIDGEGHFERRRAPATGLRLAVSQVDGPVLDRMRAHCEARKYGAYVISDDGDRKTKFGGRPVHALCVSNTQSMFRIMGLSRPTRYVGMRWWEGLSMPDGGEREIVSIEPVGELDLVDIQTSTGTFIAEGIVSHNSTYVEARFYWRITGEFGKRAYILTHEDAATTNLFNMTKRYNDNCPLPFKPHAKFDNAKELYFDRLDCRYSVATAGARATGRSGTGQFFHGCLSPDTIIVAPDGTPRRMGDFEIGDLVRTHRGVIAPVSFISRKRAPTLRMKVMGASEEIIATPEHRFLTADGKIPLRDLRVGDMLCYPVREIGNETLLFHYRVEHGRRPGRGGAGTVGPDALPGNFNLGRVLGLYLAEGSVFTQCSGRPAGVSFTVHRREVDRTLAWLEPFRHCWRSAPKVAHRDESLASIVTVHSRSFAEFVARLCGRLDAKRLPDEWDRSREFAHGIVVGYFSGDGGGQFNSSTRRVQAPSIRGAITFGMRDALAALGYGWATVTRRAAAKRNGRQEREQYMLRLSGPGADVLWGEMGREPLPRMRNQRACNFRIDKGFAWFPITSIVDNGEQEVMDFEVSHPDHSYCTWQCASSNSEMAFWPAAETHMAGIGQTIPDEPDTEIILESTANGIGNLYHQKWLDALEGNGEYIAIFIPWFLQNEYRKKVPAGIEWSDYEIEYQISFGLDLEQLYWRRIKVIDDFGGDETIFDQEYPATPEMAFMAGSKGSFISALSVARAQKIKRGVMALGATVIGVDPAESENPDADDSAIVVRKGSKVLRVIREHGKKGEELAGIVAVLIKEYEPDAINIDVGGIGTACEQFLTAAGHRNVHRINFGSNALEHERFADRSAEMWWHMRDFINDELTQIPRDARLQTDLVGRKSRPDARRRIRMESKEDMKKRGLKSPDSADALALTFATPLAPKESDREQNLMEKIARARGNIAQRQDDGMGA